MTLEKEIFIRENYKNMTRQEMADKLKLAKSSIDRFMLKHKLKATKRRTGLKATIKRNDVATSFIRKNYRNMSYQEIADKIGYAEATVRNYVAMHLQTEDTLTGELKRYYDYMKNIFERNKVAVGRINTNFKELMALARLKKEGLIRLIREEKGRYTVILN